MANLTAVRVLLTAESACFPRPEFRRDEVTYDVLTPSAARGVLDRVHWRPAIRWVINAISILRPICVCEYRTSADEHLRRRSIILRDVGYLIDAHFDLTAKAGPLDEPERPRGMFRRQVRSGASVFLGGEAYPGEIRLLEDAAPEEGVPINETRDLGWMVHEADYQDRGRLRFFRAHMIAGVVTVPPPGDPRLFG